MKKLKPGKEFYEKYYSISDMMHPIERMKQESRIKTIEKLMPEDVNKILFIGCGQGEELKVCKEPAVGLDLSFCALKKAKEKRPKDNFVEGDACNLPFKSDSFDCVVCSEVLEHLAEPRKAISEFARILSKEGSVVITTPNWRSFYGLFRKIAEFISKHPVTASNQPIDNWFTPKSLKDIVEPYFSISKIMGCWYFPPTGKGNKQIPCVLTYPIFKLLLPIDRFLSKKIPSYGHIIVVQAHQNNFNLLYNRRG